MCPKADDPVTINQNDRKIAISLISTGSALGGVLKVNYLGHTAEFDLAASAGQTSAYCKAQWEKLDNIETVTCAVANQVRARTAAAATDAAAAAVVALLPPSLAPLVHAACVALVHTALCVALAHTVSDYGRPPLPSARGT